MVQNALMIYFTWGGRTQKIAETIGKSLTNYEVTYAGIKMTGMTQLDEFEKGNFSAVAPQLDSLDAFKYDLIFFGMPTYGNVPPKIFDEIVRKITHIEGKKVVVFATARFTRGAAAVMKTKMEAKGANVIDQFVFKGLFRINPSSAVAFGQKFN